MNTNGEKTAKQVLVTGTILLVSWILLLQSGHGSDMQRAGINAAAMLMIMSALAYRTRHTIDDTDDVDFLTFLQGIYKIEAGEELQFGGVCSGLGAAGRIPTYVWRIAFVIWGVVNAGGAIVTYGLLSFCLPASKVVDEIETDMDVDDIDDPPPTMPPAEEQEASPPPARPASDTAAPQLSQKTQDRLAELKKEKKPPDDAS